MSTGSREVLHPRLIVLSEVREKIGHKTETASVMWPTRVGALSFRIVLTVNVQRGYHSLSHCQTRGHSALMGLTREAGLFANRFLMEITTMDRPAA